MKEQIFLKTIISHIINYTWPVRFLFGEFQAVKSYHRRNIFLFLLEISFTMRSFHIPWGKRKKNNTTLIIFTASPLPRLSRCAPPHLPRRRVLPPLVYLYSLNNFYIEAFYWKYTVWKTWLRKMRKLKFGAEKKNWA